MVLASQDRSACSTSSFGSVCVLKLHSIIWKTASTFLTSFHGVRGLDLHGVCLFRRKGMFDKTKFELYIKCSQEVQPELNHFLLHLLKYNINAKAKKKKKFDLIFQISFCERRLESKMIISYSVAHWWLLALTLKKRFLKNPMSKQTLYDTLSGFMIVSTFYHKRTLLIYTAQFL